MTAEPAPVDLDWLTQNDPEQMLRGVWSQATPRQGLLIACAAGRAIWGLLPEDCRHVIELAEECADGKVSRQELSQAEFRTRVRASSMPSSDSCP